jgi:hypothetical protein
MGMVLKIAFAVLLISFLSEFIQHSAPSAAQHSNTSNAQMHGSELNANLHEASTPNWMYQFRCIAELEETSSHSTQDIIVVAIEKLLIFRTQQTDFASGFQMVKSNWIPSYIRFCALKIPF